MSKGYRVDKFESNGKTMVVVRMKNAACVMSEYEYNKYFREKRKRQKHIDIECSTQRIVKLHKELYENL